MSDEITSLEPTESTEAPEAAVDTDDAPEVSADGSEEPRESRSQRARREREELRREAAEAKEEARRAREEAQREAAELRAQVAEMRGYVTAQQETRQQAQRDAEPTPRDLRAKAREALKAGDVDAYEELNTQAIKIEVRADIESRIPKQAPAMNPVLNGILMAHPAVIEAGDDGVAITKAKDLLLARKGMKQGPARLKMALEMAEKELLGDSPPKQSYSQGNAGVLAGVPVTRTGSASTDDLSSLAGRLTEHELTIQKRSGMTLKEYVGYMQRKSPERFR